MKTNLLGPPAMVKDRLRQYRDAGITTIQAKVGGSRGQQLDTLAQLVALTDEVSREGEPASAPRHAV